MNTPIDGKQRAVGWVLGKYTVRNLQYVRLDDYDMTVIRSDARIAELTAEVDRLEHLVGLKNVSISGYRSVLESIDLTYRDLRLTTERSRSIMADIARNALKEGKSRA